ncbi:hypothetical protein WJ47_27850 [Burkholderia ubonensis]|uniref:Uncharacterized protein n=1 Tax=Burkholderia ubonensis TaxID=101571 RepID=A0AB73G0N7_9BURK|nr:hypothetical protein [Burkholderia ubonensis]KVK85235.1 hypothetical protein WJ44_03750 [Burkholderia ubonensis]KVL79330.1 hypothetical protein WJ47_27850 [Burkholderia ubonensis]KVM32794.1 hypothetical protein WJ53_03900 [Burkholderia ubonensis]KVM39872.1 hypothetical protein WJ54_30060 [Burkholderia ubonensis]
MNSTDKAVGDYQGAVKRLFQAAFDQLRVEDPEYYASCSLVLASGGMVELRSCAMAGGVLETAISIVDAAGEKSEVCRIETGATTH